MNFGCETCYRFVVYSVSVSEDRVGTLSNIVSYDQFVRNSDLNERLLKSIHTGGISFGKSTSFLIVKSPLSSGQESSTFLTCSQRSTVCFTSVMRPYLTWRTT